MTNKTQEHNGLVSVVIPHYNRLQSLLLCITSTYNQTYKDIEIIVVDDGSDNVSEIETAVKSINNDITFISLGGNHGAPTARNRGADASVGEFILFCDCDTVFNQDAIKRMVDGLNNNQDCDFAYGGFTYGGCHVIPIEFNLDKLKEGNYINSTSLVRRNKFTRWDESLKRLQDWDLWLGMALGGSKGVCVGDNLYTAEAPVVGGISHKDNPITIEIAMKIVKEKYNI